MGTKTTQRTSLAEKISLGVRVGAIALLGITIAAVVFFGLGLSRPQQERTPTVFHHASTEIFSRDDAVT